MGEHVVIFAGPMGAGKTTAIRALSEVEVVSTEAANSDRAVVDKETTTVALDYGEIGLTDSEKVRLYGVPGQRRFSFMWSILKERARGVIVLVAGDSPDPLGGMLEFVDEFRDLYERGGMLVGVTRTDLGVGPPVARYGEALAEAFPSLAVPVMALDPRDPAHMRMALMTLIVNVETRERLQAVAS
ncbi:GTP-binding protein [Homoserinimonas aerilata]|uniref:GTP-binding protein n=1 Tax=Homoserinimonas aerilata TaxID=1162970 RepID=UPI001151D2C8|nr:ATP/GTP-binding protein [Homoserinimonas aerilata]